MQSGWRLSMALVAACACMLTLPMLAPAGSENDDRESKPDGKGMVSLLSPRKGDRNDAAMRERFEPGGGSIDQRNQLSRRPCDVGYRDVYYIWYGNWSGNSATTILTDFASNLGGSPYFNINTTYYNGANTHSVTLSHLPDQRTTITHSERRSSDADVQNRCQRNYQWRAAATRMELYFVLTSKDVAEIAASARSTALGTPTERSPARPQVRFRRECRPLPVGL